jgi:hypothetical protein
VIVILIKRTLIMLASRDDILKAALELSETDRLLVAERLLETLPEDVPGMSVDDPEFLEELERRFRDKSAGVPISEIWQSRTTDGSDERP